MRGTSTGWLHSRATSRLIQEADLTYPIIVGPDNRVMDGMHRIGRALLEGRTTIDARRLTELTDPDFEDCKPDELRATSHSPGLSRSRREPS